MPVTRHHPNRGALGVWQVRHSLRRVQAPENPGGLRASGRSLEGLVDTGRHPVVSGGAPVPGRLSVLSVVDLCHGRQLAPVNEEGGHPREPQARGGGRRPGCTPAASGWVDRQASRILGKQIELGTPPPQSSGEPERGAGSPQGLGVYGGMLPLPEATRKAAPPSGAGVSRPLDALPLRGGFGFRPGPSVIPGQTLTGCRNQNTPKTPAPPLLAWLPARFPRLENRSARFQWVCGVVP